MNYSSNRKIESKYKLWKNDNIVKKEKEGMLDELQSKQEIVKQGLQSN